MANYETFEEFQQQFQQYADNEALIENLEHAIESLGELNDNQNGTKDAE